MNIQIPITLLPNGELDRETLNHEWKTRCEALEFALNGKGTHSQVMPTKSTRSMTKRDEAEVSLGEMLCPPKKRGRKPDPNSALQRVNRAVRDMLGKKGEMARDDLFQEVIRVTGLSMGKVMDNAMQVPGVKRNYGQWSLKAA